MPKLMTMRFDVFGLWRSLLWTTFMTFIFMDNIHFISLIPAGITAVKAEQDLVEFIFAAMVDTVIYKWFQIHCEGCQEHYPSQRDHACLNYGSMDSLIGLYFREFHLLVCTDWVVGACQTYLKHTQYHVIVSMVEDLRKQWVNSPQLAADAKNCS